MVRAHPIDDKSLAPTGWEFRGAAEQERGGHYPIFVNRMAVSFSCQHTAVAVQVTNQIPALHGLGVATCCENC